MQSQNSDHFCSYCDKHFDYRWKLIRHERCHTNERPFVCQYCGKAFTESGNVVKHVRVHHKLPEDQYDQMHSYRKKPEEKSIIQQNTADNSSVFTNTSNSLDAVFGVYRCDCGLRFKHRTRMKQHQLYCQYRTNKLKANENMKKEQLKKQKNKTCKMNTVYEFRCDKCSCTFRSIRSLQDHKKRVHKRKRIRKSTTVKQLLLQTHNSAGRRVDKQTTILSGSRRKKRTASASVSVAAASVSNLIPASISETERDKDGSCHDCGKYIQQKNWGQHRRSHTLCHLNAKCLTGNTSSLDTLYLCRYKTCNRAFLSFEAMTGHEMVHIDSKPYVCDLCDERSQTRHRHENHIRKCMSYLMKFPCSRCGKLFGKNSELVRHEDAHSKKADVSYICGHCSKVYPTRIDLNRHNIERHKKMVPQPKDVIFQCKFCSMKLTSKDDLLDHAQTDHWSEIADTDLVVRPSGEETTKKTKDNTGYHCDFCSKTFRYLSRLKEHEMIHTKEKPYVCQQCGLTFTFRYTLKQHLETCKPTTQINEDISHPEDADQDQDDVISISSSSSPSPSPSPLPTPNMQSVQIQRLKPVPVSQPGASVYHQFTAGNNAEASTATFTETRDQIYLIQYSSEHMNQVH